MKEMNREMELNMDELEQVNGGNIVCILYGVTDEATESAACIADGHGFAACVSVLGIGVGGDW